MKYAGASDTSVQVAEQAVGIAQVVTGATSPAGAVAMLNSNSEKAMEFRIKITEQEKSWDEMYLKDIQSARERDTKLHEAGYRNTRANWMLISAYIGVGICFFAVITDETMNEYTKGIITLVLGRMLGYIDQGFNFEFGTTRTSRAKDDTITKLTNGGGR